MRPCVCQCASAGASARGGEAILMIQYVGIMTRWYDRVHLRARRQVEAHGARGKCSGPRAEEAMQSGKTKSNEVFRSGARLLLAITLGGATRD